MAAFTALAMALGTGVQLYGSMMQANAQKTMAENERKAAQWQQNVKQQQMQLDVQRRQRQAIRSTLVSRAMALSSGANQGAEYGSGVAGGLSQAMGEGSGQIQTASASQYLGQQLGKANMAMVDARTKGMEDIASAQAISSFGGALVSVAPTIGRLGRYATGNAYA